MQRRSFLMAGSLSLASLNWGLPTFGAENKKEKSVVFIWLGGGIAGNEFTMGNVDATDPYKSVTGYVKTNTGEYIGSLWENLAKQADKYSIVRSFGHGNSGHQGGTGYVNTGYNFLDENPGAAQTNPSYGSIVSKFNGPFNSTGIPNYVALDNYFGLKSSYLGQTFNPFSIDEQGKANLELKDMERVLARQELIKSVDKGQNQNIEKSFSVLLGKTKEAFDIKLESEKMRERYGSHRFAEKLLMARRLIQNGVKTVTVSEHSFDYHDDIKGNMTRHVPDIDKAIATFIQDMSEQGLLENTLVVITTEFGRTRLNKGNNGTGADTGRPGRDHFAIVTPLILVGKNYQGKIIGTTNKNADEPKDTPYYPVDLLKTITSHMNIPANATVTDLSGRPRYLVDNSAKIIT